MKEIIKLILDSVDIKVSSDSNLFNATQLNEAWSVDKYGLEKYIATTKREELVEYICEQEALFNSSVLVYKDNDIYMHPILFLDFALWLNPKFKYDLLVNLYLSSKYLNGKTLL